MDTHTRAHAPTRTCVHYAYIFGACVRICIHTQQESPPTHTNTNKHTHTHTHTQKAEVVQVISVKQTCRVRRNVAQIADNRPEEEKEEEGYHSGQGSLGQHHASVSGMRFDFGKYS
jgi:hypothetical protein